LRSSVPLRDKALPRRAAGCTNGAAPNDKMSELIECERQLSAHDRPLGRSNQSPAEEKGYPVHPLMTEHQPMTGHFIWRG
jgi:hypothetical protein